MNKERLAALLESVKKGELSIEDALEKFKALPFEDIGFAKIDTHREIRTGFPEVIFCRGKTVEQVERIFKKMSERSNRVMATRATPEMFKAVKKAVPAAAYHESSQIILWGDKPSHKTTKTVAVVSAGTSDIPVAEEAAVTAEVMGCPVERLFDIGVAGVHRLLDNRERLFKANVVVAVAGMEGALASVIGGLVDKPVVAVPTSIGYGASFNGLAALLSMLNTCAPGVAVVNIDNGFGAGYFAAMVNLMENGK